MVKYLWRSTTCQLNLVATSSSYQNFVSSLLSLPKIGMKNCPMKVCIQSPLYIPFSFFSTLSLSLRMSSLFSLPAELYVYQAVFNINFRVV